jgi:hypothetical protein
MNIAVTGMAKIHEILAAVANFSNLAVTLANVILARQYLH